MITCTQNNFGAGEILFNDYQREGFCVLNGKFTVDATNAAYLAATRLEIVLPSDFCMKKSAMSSAILVSASSAHNYGTVLRCQIEGGRLCFEKLSDWDEFGQNTIYLHSAFTELGYRGKVARVAKTKITVDKSWQASRILCHVNEDFMVITAYFRNFAKSNTSIGPYSFKLDGVPTDVDADLIILPSKFSFSKNETHGSPLIAGRLQNGYISFRYHEGETNLGGDGTSFCAVLLRGKYVQRPQKIGAIELGTDDILPEGKLIVGGFRFSSATLPSAVSVDALFMYRGYPGSFNLSLKSYPEAAPYTMGFMLLGRSSKYECYQVVAYDMVFMQQPQVLSFRRLTTADHPESEIFGTTMFIRQM